MTKQRTHEFVIRVTFDRKCTASHALTSVKDCIHGEFYPFQPDYDRDPGEFKVKSFKHLKREQKR